MQNDPPLAYFITFTCYGTRLQGSESGSVDRNHNSFGAALLPPQRGMVQAEQKMLRNPPYDLNGTKRTLVLQAVKDVCGWRGWSLLAAHVRRNHVHFVVAAEATPERVLNDVKAYASRKLNRSGVDSASARRWTRHGSTVYLWKPEQVEAAVNYVVREQGAPMAVWERP